MVPPHFHCFCVTACFAHSSLHQIISLNCVYIPPSTVIVSSLILDAVDRVVINLRRSGLLLVILGVSSSTCIILGKFSSFSPNPKGLPRDLRAPVLRHTAHLGFQYLSNEIENLKVDTTFVTNINPYRYGEGLFLCPYCLVSCCTQFCTPQ